jgi:eukaryotic-like serine/threonine-protein kinase
VLTVLSPEDWDRLQGIFEAAALLTGDERERFLVENCAGSAERRAQVESLLAALQTATRGEGIVGATAYSVLEARLPEPGARVGSYLITGIVGRGGMGVVYRAVRADGSFQKEVAIKMASSGLLSPEQRERFLRERQLMAALDHPNIARLLDGGATEEGLPYVVMELVDGRPLHRYCDDNKLDVRQKIELLLPVIRAVAYAHSRLVVHRDLKPENILVTASGEPKLLDFGIAKALEPDRQGLDFSQTVDAARLLTPAYASPEQIQGKAITTDVYQLGAVLYHLLTGRRLFDLSSTRAAELERAICDQEPARPGLDADLDRIVLHCLEKEPARRYSSAAALADDLERYLKGFPIAARSPSAAYLARKFVERYRWLVALGALCVLLLIAGTVWLSVDARRLALERNQARIELARSERVSHLLETVFEGADPETARGTNPTARELLDRGTIDVTQNLGAEPAVQASLYLTLGRVYSSLGVYDKSLDLFDRAVKLSEQQFGPNSAELANALDEESIAAMELDKLGQAQREAERALRIRQQIGSGDSVETGQALKVLGRNLWRKGDLKESETYLRSALAMLEKTRGANSPELIDTLRYLGYTLRDEGNAQEAYTLFLRTYTIYKAAYGDSDLRTSDAMNSTGQILNVMGRYDEAESYFRRALAIRRRVLGPDHPSIAVTENNLASLLEDKGDFDEAEKLYLDAIRIQTASNGPGSLEVAIDNNNLASLYEEEKKYKLAEPLFRASLEARRKIYGPDHFVVARAENNLGRLLTEEDKYREAQSLLLSALALRKKAYGENHPETARTYVALGDLEEALHHPAEAESDLRRAVSIDRARYPSGHPSLASALVALGEFLLSQKRDKEAAEVLTEAVNMERKTLPPGSWRLREPTALLAKAEAGKQVAAR